jgi:hypothetical protein
LRGNVEQPPSAAATPARAPVPHPPALPSISKTNLILIGTVHGDPGGYCRAWRLLQHLQPELVTVEISHFSVRYRQKRQAHWRRLFTQALRELPPGAARHLAIRRVEAQIVLPFEYLVARDFCGQRGLGLELLDIGGLARRHLPRYSRELLSPQNLQALLETPDGSFTDSVAREFHRARRQSGRPAWRFSGPDLEQMQRREKWLALRLRKLAAGGRRLAHLGGWEHLVPWQDGGGLPSLLADRQPVRLLLDEADGLDDQEYWCVKRTLHWTQRISG